MTFATFLPPRASRSQLHAALLLACAASGPAAAQMPLDDPAAPDLTLAPVVVTATRFADDAAALPYGVSVVTAAEIRNAGVSSVTEALMKLLGVPGRLDLAGGGDYRLDLRGFGETAGSNQVVVVDGLRVNEADLGAARLAGIAIDTVERIEVVRGGGAVLYGEGATGGVIVITTRAAAAARARTAATSTPLPAATGCANCARAAPRRAAASRSTPQSTAATPTTTATTSAPAPKAARCRRSGAARRCASACATPRTASTPACPAR